jgi:hypothetical protein
MFPAILLIILFAVIWHEEPANPAVIERRSAEKSAHHKTGVITNAPSSPPVETKRT